MAKSSTKVMRELKKEARAYAGQTTIIKINGKYIPVPKDLPYSEQLVQGQALYDELMADPEYVARLERNQARRQRIEEGLALSRQNAAERLQNGGLTNAELEAAQKNPRVAERLLSISEVTPELREALMPTKTKPSAE